MSDVCFESCDTLPTNGVYSELVQNNDFNGAVWDMQFKPHDASVVAVASSIGFIELYSINVSDWRMSMVARHQLYEHSIAITYLAWHPSAKNILACGLSNGEIHRVTLPPEESDQTHRADTMLMNKHNLQHRGFAGETTVWGCAWGANNVLYSGGDDSRLRLVVDSTPIQDGQDTGFEAGVTSILPLDLSWLDNEIILVGSQDHVLRLYYSDQFSPISGRPVARPAVSEIRLDGPIYRLKLARIIHDKDVKTQRAYVIVSCQQSGFRIVEISFSDELQLQLKVVGWLDTKDIDKQLCYGIACHDTDENKAGDAGPQRVCRIITSSFYEKTLRICDWDISKTQ